MKLKTFNTTNVQSFGRAQAAFISISSTTGLFTLNKASAELIGAKDGTMIQFHQSEDEPTDWYIEVVKEDGFQIRTSSKIGQGFLFNSSKLAHIIFDSVAYTGKGGRVYVGESIKPGKQTLFTLITARLINQ